MKPYETFITDDGRELVWFSEDNFKKYMEFIKYQLNKDKAGDVVLIKFIDMILENFGLE